MQKQMDMRQKGTMLTLDFVCIHPFNARNGRMNRLLTLPILYRAGYLAGKCISIEAVFDRRVSKVTKADILAECPDVSTTTMERALADLQKRGLIEKVGRGRSTGYVKASS